MAKTLDFVLADVFTDRPFGGNQLAVFPRAMGLPAGTMQAIARELNLNESAFVFPPKTPEVTYTVRFFTPRTELPFAGHPTIGTALVLDAVGALDHAQKVDRSSDGSKRIVLGEGIGPVPVCLTRYSGVAGAVLTSPRIPVKVAEAPQADIMAALLGLRSDSLSGEIFPAGGYSAGVPFLSIPLQDQAALARVRLDAATWATHVKDSSTPHIVALTLDPRNDRQFDIRMFAPAMGIPEDPATGAAAVALGGFLADQQRLPTGTTRWLIRQGLDMGRPSLINLEVDVANDAVAAVRVGGNAVIVGRGSLDLP
jgi:trans-2,3-dihydro-3-hydroxyanthranilate isomerase